MSELDDFDLGSTDEEPPPPPRLEDDDGRRALWIAGGVFATLVLLAAGGYLWLRDSTEPAQRPSPPASAVPSPTAEPSATPTPLALPSLEESDALVRELAKALSGNRLFGAWLGAQDLIRRLAAAVVAVAEGSPLHQPLDFLAPEGAFSVLERRGRTVIAPTSYARYDGIAGTVSSIDAPAAVAVLRRLEPLLDAACRELGQDTGFAPLLERAVHLLLSTPIPEGDVEVRRLMRARAVYVYARPELETLRPAQKHLLRMGPDNARKVTAKLRELLLALAPPASPPGADGADTGTAPGPSAPR